MTYQFGPLLLLLYGYMWQRYILLCVLVFLPLVSGAQFDLGSFGAPSLNITLDPAFPSPGQTVTASIDDDTANFKGITVFTVGRNQHFWGY